ncbi:hypothetical protein [Paraburkholderia guartelaensis]|uniref:hypothetical protein n=1 Tax=Paraburkholderia guartelaensis TaxID=2546446 RepID=UPI002AB6FA9B|nr:hypothetical protein [Paraburkholderia guartelaensis]
MQALVTTHISLSIVSIYLDLKKEEQMAYVKEPQVVDRPVYRSLSKRGSRVVLLSGSGNTGKSALAALIQAVYRARIFSITSEISQDAAQFRASIDARFAPDETYECFRDMFLCQDNVVIDVGGTAIECFLEKASVGYLSRLVDVVVLVVDRTSRGQEDALSCLEVLRMGGFRDQQIRFLFTRKKQRESVDFQFETMLAYGADHPGVKINPKCVIPELTFFDLFRKSGMSFGEVFAMHDSSASVAESLVSTFDSSASTETSSTEEFARHAKRARACFARAVKELQLGMEPREALGPWL